ncbi:MAG TPA: AAA family ATPase [Steroidobacter sp.]|nr:AAA family ATPase [Steroidobacter sp.]
MSIVIVFLCGALLGFFARPYFVSAGKRDAKPSAPASLPAHAAGAPALAEESVTARLFKMVSVLDGLGEASSHPRDLIDNPEFRQAVAVLQQRDAPLDLVMDYINGANWMLSTVACAALCERADREAAAAFMTSNFRGLRPWPVYFALRYLADLNERPPLGLVVLRAPEYWADNTVVPGLLAEHFRQRVGRGDEPVFGDALADLTAAEVEQADALLRKIEHVAAGVLRERLAEWKRTKTDRAFLQAFGRFWEADPEQQLLIEHEPIAEQLALALACIEHAPARSILAVAETRAGKTAFLKLLGARATERGWSVFEASAAGLMSGQQYIGQLEERLRRLSTELSVDKRLVWYVPDLVQLAMSGTHQGQSASILDQVFPAIAQGRIVVITETTPAGLTRLLQQKPALRGVVEVLRLRALKDAEVAKLAREFAARLERTFGVSMSKDAVEDAEHLTRHYLGAEQLPGALLDLIKLAAQKAASADATSVKRDDLLLTLSQVTGMPRSVLDDRQRIELASVRDFFGARVMGQAEAVGAVVDRIAMLKAGLTDPGKPIAVFLFAGPTGTGKTELAKTLAEFLFGSSERLLRLDMSEFQSAESTRKILGGGDARDELESLTHRIRKQPFSVVLLDEFEKANPNVWDLFLQVFDDGRLTDAAGRIADFRHAIIILTSNLGATAHQGGAMGFLPQMGGFSSEQVLRAVNQSFRPEFVNRLDRVIVFRPLTRELMRGILAKELGRVLERRNLRHREWAVEWESSALDFLLDKGFSAAMGARPLKRAIDQYLLAPLAATMVEHRFPEGDQFLFVRSDGRAIQVEFVDPDDGGSASAPTEASQVGSAGGATLARMMLQPSGSDAEAAELRAELQRLQARFMSAEWEELRSVFAAEMNDSNFWERTDRRVVLTQYALMDRVQAAMATAVGLANRLQQRAGRAGMYSRDLIARLASQLHLVELGIDDALGKSPIEVVLSATSAMDRGADPVQAREWCGRLLHMYRGWAAQRRMQIEEVTDAEASLLVVCGFGAARILSSEAGLHVLERDSTEDSGRCVARVKVAPTGAERGAEASVRELASILERSSASTSVVRRYREGASPLVRDARKGWRTGRAELVFAGHFDLIEQIAHD